MLAAVAWTGLGDHINWSDPLNWSSGALPGASDGVTINLAGSQTIVFSSTLGSRTVASLNGSDPLSITGGSLTVTGNSTLTGTLSMNGGSLNASGTGVAFTATGVTTISGAGLTALGGASLTLPNLSSYSGAIGATNTVQASGTGSLLSLPNLLSITEDTTSYVSRVQFQALLGGHVNLATLTQISGGPVILDSDGSSSALGVSALTSFRGANGQEFSSGFQVTHGGTLLDGNLTSMDNAAMNLDGTGTLSTSQIATFTNATATVTGGNPNFNGLTNINGSAFQVSGGASVTLPGITSYSGHAGFAYPLWASGAGTLLSLPNLAMIAEDTTNYVSEVQFQALSGGHVNLATLTQISGGPVILDSDGSSSALGVSALTSFRGANGQEFSSGLQVTHGGTLLDGNLTSMDNAAMNLDGTGTLSTSQIATFTNATATVTGGNPNFNGLTNINGSAFQVSAAPPSRCRE